MTIILTADLVAKLFPKAPKAIATAFVAKQNLLAEILASNERFAICIGNLYAETSGYSLSGLTEDIWYSQTRMAHVWPNRFHNNASEVAAKYGTASGWQLKAFDDIYGGRMGNRPDTHDGSNYIGRGGPQLTGRLEYSDIGSLIGVDLIGNPTKAADPELQVEILAAYWKSKKLSPLADSNQRTKLREVWNGGTNGLATSETYYAKSLAILKAYNPTTAAVVVAVPTATKDLRLQAIQQSLIGFGYHEVGDDDGLMGGKTKGAIVAFCNDRGIASLIYPSQASDIEMAIQDAIDVKWHRPVAPGRAFATTEQLAPKIASIAPTQKASFLSKITAWASTVGGTTTAAVQFMPTAHDTATPYIAMAHEWFDKIPGWVPFAAVAAIAVATVVQTNKANKATTAAYQQGKIN